MDSRSVILSLLLASAGVVAGWFLQVITSEIKERQEIRRGVSSASAACFGRLKKMQIARQNSKTNVFNDEKAHLGKDSDTFVQAISRRNKIKKGEMAVYENMCELLLDVHQNDAVDEKISELIEELHELVIYEA